MKKSVPKIEKTYHKKHPQVSLVLTDKPLIDKRLVFPDELIQGTFENTCQMPDAQPPSHHKIANAPPPRLTM